MTKNLYTIFSCLANYLCPRVRHMGRDIIATGWRHGMETFLALLSLCSYFLCCKPEQVVEQSVELLVIWDALNHHAEFSQGLVTWQTFWEVKEKSWIFFFQICLKSWKINETFSLNFCGNPVMWQHCKATDCPDCLLLQSEHQPYRKGFQGILSSCHEPVPGDHFKIDHELRVQSKSSQNFNLF